MAKHIDLGKKGEAIARSYLEKKGYDIQETNWRHEKDELDIIAWDQNVLVVVEVKTRSTEYFGQPEEAVDQAKESYLIRGAESYVNQHSIDTDIRFDIISVILNADQETITHIIDAFYPE